MHAGEKDRKHEVQSREDLKEIFKRSDAKIRYIFCAIRIRPGAKSTHKATNWEGPTLR